MLSFVKVNLNPKNRKRDDCVVRAIAGASGLSWDEVYRGLCEIGGKIKAMPNEKITYEKYLSEIGFIKHPQPYKRDGTKYAVGEADKLIGLDTAVISLANHLTVAKNGVIEDLWDCRRKRIGNYWTPLRR